MKPLVKITENIVEKRLSRLGAIQIQTEIGYIKQLEEKDFQKEVFTNDPDLISNVLPDGELKLAMQRFEISRKKMLS